MNIELIKTADGSYSFYRSDLDETYHSRHGAHSESMHVFVENGLLYYTKKNPSIKTIGIYELGFGTGLNAIWSFNNSSKALYYYGVEKHPIFLETHCKWLALNTTLPPESTDIIKSPWDIDVAIGQHTLHKATEDILNKNKATKAFDLVYFDAFGFRAQERLWQLDVCQYMFSLLKPGGMLVTYSSKGLFRRNLQEAGFVCEKIPGPSGKREMLRAHKA